MKGFVLQGLVLFLKEKAAITFWEIAAFVTSCFMNHNR
jgi:hypothetical protein